MRLDYLTIKGLGPFHERTHVDLRNLRGIVALVGENGTGKSTALECYHAAVDRRLPTTGKGTLKSIACSRDSYVEAGVTNGASYTIRQMVDAVSGKGEAFVADAQGVPQLTTASVKEYDTWAREHLPPSDVFDASMFSAQKSAGFLEMGETERQGLILKTLGIERYEAMAERCRKNAAAASARYSTIVARIGDEERRGGNLEEAERNLDLARADDADAAECLDSARRAVTAATQAAFDTKAKVDRADEALAPLDALIAEHERQAADANARREEAKTKAEAAKGAVLAKLRDARARVADLEARIANNRRLLEQADAIREAGAKDAALAAELEGLTATLATHRAEADKWAERERAAVKARAAAESRVKAETDRAASLRTRLDADERAVRDAQDQLPELEAAWVNAERALSDARCHAEKAEEVAGVTAEKRIGALRLGLNAIAYGSVVDPSVTAGETLEADDESALSQHEAPARLRAARNELRSADIARQAAADALADAKRRAAGEDRLDALRADLETAVKAADGFQSAVDEADDEAKEAAQLALDARGRIAETEKAIRATREAKAALADLVAKAERLRVAEERIAGLDEQLRATRDAIADLEEASPDSEPPEAARAAEEAAEHLRRAKEARDRRVDLLETLDIAREDAAKGARHLGTAEALAQAAERRAREASAAVAVAVAAFDRAKATDAALVSLRAERVEAEAELADWNLLAESLGADGLQALETDAAGPELSALINDLLRTCSGSKWTVSLETTRSSADGKKQIETCRVVVTDNEQAIRPENYKASGGQAVIINEAISLAFTVLACRRSGAHGVTLVRDESGAALDATNARGYIAMLRRASDIVGADKVLLVSHSPAVQELADSRILVKDGRLEVAA